MIRFKFILFGCISLCGLSLPSIVVGSSNFSVVGRTSGVLAVREKEATPWRVIPVGGILPDLAEVRTSADGPVEIHVGTGDSLFLGPLSRARIDLTKRHVSLVSGRVFGLAPATLSWSILTGRTQTDITDGGVDVVLTSGHDLHVTVSAGSAKVKVPDAKPVILATATSKRWRPDGTETETIRISDEEADRLTAWTKPLPPSQGPGQLVITDAQSKSLNRLAIARYHAELVLTPPVALVKLDQAFYNPSSSQLEGEFLFNLPPGASVSRFAMYVTPTELIEGELIDRRKANQVYTAIVNRRRDPAILEKIGDTLFKMRVFPIFAKDIKRILLDYTVPLEGQSGQYHMQLPLLSDLEPIWDFRLHGKIQGNTPLASVRSVTHPDIQFLSSGPDQIRFDFTRRQFRPMSHFLLSFQQNVSDQPTLFRSLLADPLKLPGTIPGKEISFAIPGAKGEVISWQDRWNESPATYFLTNLPNPTPPAAIEPADILILLETSSNLKTIDRLRPALYSVVQNLRPEDRFRLVCVDAAPRPLHQGWLTVGTDEAKAALNNFEKQVCIGANDILATSQSIANQFSDLEKADTTTAVASRRRIVLYLGEVQDIVTRNVIETQLQITQAFVQELNTARADFWAADVLAVRKNLDATANSQSDRNGNRNQDRLAETAQFKLTGKALLKQLAQMTRGRFFDLADQPQDRDRYFAWILSGCASTVNVTGVSVASADKDADERAHDLYITPGALPGEPLHLTGRIAPAQRLRIQYTIQTSQSKSVEHQMELNAGPDHTDYLVGRYWAERHFEHLDDLTNRSNIVGGNPLALDAIVRHCREWTLLTPYTAFLVLENEREYLSWGVPRQARRRYWTAVGSPASLPLPENWIASMAPDSALKSYRAYWRDTAKQPTNPVALETIQTKLEDARRALSKGDLATAERVLDSILNSNPVPTPEYQKLRSELAAARSRAKAFEDLGYRRAWFEPLVARPLPMQLNSLLTTQVTIPPSFLKRHPLAPALLREFDHPGGTMPLNQFTQWLKSKVGVDVLLDAKSLEDERISVETVVTLPPQKKATLFSIIPLVLKPISLQCFESPHSLQITTGSSKNSLQRHLFPVQDLISAQPRFNLVELHDPLLSRQEQFEKRLNEKLQRVMPVRLKDATLQDFAGFLREQLDCNVMLDLIKLAEESYSPEVEDLNVNTESLPLGDAMRWVLRTKELGLRIEDEVLVITTKSAAAGYRTIRVYPGHDLIQRQRVGSKPMWGTTGWSRRYSGNSIFDGMIGAGMGGFGGMGGGGFGGMGGVSFSSSGFGGMAGGRAGGSTNSPFAPPSEDSTSPPSISEFADPLDLLQDPTVESSTPAPEMESLTPIVDNTLPPGELFTTNVSTHVSDVMRLTGGTDEGGTWYQIEGEGGDIAFDLPSLSFAVKQTPEVQKQVEDYLRDQREAQNHGNRNPQTVPLDPRTLISSQEQPNPYPLMQMIMQLTGGLDQGSPWFQIDGEGGDVAWNEAQLSLNIRQNSRTLDEVNQLLVKLRRERYAVLHNSRPWERASTGSPINLSLIPSDWTAQSDTPNLKDQRPAQPKQNRSQATPEELKLLQVRRATRSGTWSLTDSRGHQQLILTVHSTKHGRLRVTWPGREIRIDGQTTAVIAPDLQFAEIGAWGDAAREWLDIEIPGWPHRSNQELAELFEITQAPVSNTASKPESTPSDQPIGTHTLRFVPSGFQDQSTWIDVRFDTDSGDMVEWTASTRGQTPRRFTLSTNRVDTNKSTSGTTVTPQANTDSKASGQAPSNVRILSYATPSGATGYWSPSNANSLPLQISAPTELPPQFLVLDRRDGAAGHKIPGLAKFREGHFTEAAAEFRALLEKDSAQPLIKFLLAWSLDQQDQIIPLEQVQTAFRDALKSGPPELAQFLMDYPPRRLTPRETYLLLDANPEVKRTIDEEIRLSNWFLNNDFMEPAVAHAELAWSQKPESEIVQFEIIKLIVRGLLKRVMVPEALEWTKLWMSGPGIRPLAQVRQLLDLFESQGLANRVEPIYAELFQRPDVQALPSAERRALYLWHAKVMSPFSTLSTKRWNSLLSACALLPTSDSKLQQREINELVQELRQSPETTADVVAQLLELTTLPVARQELRAVLADQTLDSQSATQIDWQLHESGYKFLSNLNQVLERMNQTQQFEKCVRIAESRLREGLPLEPVARHSLATAYQALNQHAAAARVMSTP